LADRDLFKFDEPPSSRRPLNAHDHGISTVRQPDVYN